MYYGKEPKELYLATNFLKEDYKMNEEMKSILGIVGIAVAGGLTTLIGEHVGKKCYGVIKDKMNKEDKPEVKEPEEK